MRARRSGPRRVFPASEVYGLQGVGFSRPLAFVAEGWWSLYAGLVEFRFCGSRI